MAIISEQLQHLLQVKAAEAKYASVEEYLQALLDRDAQAAAASAANDLERFHQNLRQVGLLLSNPLPPAQLAEQPFEPVAIAGDPLSKTVMAERR